MLDVQVKIDRAQARLGKLPDDFRNALKAETNTLATKLRDQAKEKLTSFFATRSGEALASIKKSVRSSKNGVTGRVFSKSPVMRLLERGARPHDITPKNAKALAFLGGKFAKVVHHPGFKGHTIINAAFQAMKGEIRAGLEAAVKDAAKANEASAP